MRDKLIWEEYNANNMQYPHSILFLVGKQVGVGDPPSPLCPFLVCMFSCICIGFVRYSTVFVTWVGSLNCSVAYVLYYVVVIPPH